MTAELPTAFRRFVLRLLPMACLLFVPDFGLAQTSGNYCEASAAVKADFKKYDEIIDEDLTSKARRERQLATLQDMLKKHPGDFHIQRRYQMVRNSRFSVDRDAVRADYRQQMEKNPKDPIAAFLYARLLVGQQTKEAIEILNRLAQQAPDFPWTHMQLAEIYNYPNFRDPAKSVEHLKQWRAKCPTALHGIALISRSGDKELMTAVAQSLRTRLESTTNIDELGYWENVWTLEFKLKPVPEHAEVRKQIADDLKRIREKHPSSEEQLSVLIEGYKQIGDKQSRRATEDELVRLLPKSEAARTLIRTRFYDDHPYPKAEAAEAEKQAYHQALAQATVEWLKQWSNDESIWSTRINSLTSWEGSSNADVEAAYNGYLKAREKGGGWFSIPPLEVTVARFYLKRGFRLESVPALLQSGLTQIEDYEKSMGPSDLYQRTDSEDGNLRYVRLEAWPLMAEAYARLKQPDKAREVLAQLAGTTKLREQATDAQKRSFAYGQSIYWQAAGKVAEIEERKLDALNAYQAALVFRPGYLTPKAGTKDQLSENAQRLWKELGGTDQGWQAYLARNEASKNSMGTAEVSSWDTKNTVLPAFELTDLQGRKWSLADLKGKTAFINLWATWCGPCRRELPYVQMLREQMKDRKDVLVLTLNTDQEVGMVEPFMKENKYTFPVLLGQAYAESQGVNSIPRNWIVSSDGKIMFEGIGFGDDGEEWVKRATQMIEKVKGAN